MNMNIVNLLATWPVFIPVQEPRDDLKVGCKYDYGQPHV